MSTTYYVKFPECPHCHLSKESVTIGTSSIGWAFCFNPIYTYSGWLKFLQEHKDYIYNEYGDQIKLTDFWTMVDNKKDLKTGIDEYPGYFTVDENGYRFRHSKMED